jgi:dTDP-4-amino-4,6-dideoxygalactose transaminase
VRLIEYDEVEKNNYQYIILEIDEKLAGISRDLIVKILHAENVLARRYFYPDVIKWSHIVHISRTQVCCCQRQNG